MVHMRPACAQGAQATGSGDHQSPEGDTIQRRDERAEELQSRLVDADMARQQLQGEMQLREENWLANGAMRVGPLVPGADGLAGWPGEACQPEKYCPRIMHPVGLLFMILVCRGQGSRIDHRDATPASFYM